MVNHPEIAIVRNPSIFQSVEAKYTPLKYDQKIHVHIFCPQKNHQNPNPWFDGLSGWNLQGDARLEERMRACGNARGGHGKYGENMVIRVISGENVGD